MSRETLKTLRLIIPGLMILISFIPLFSSNLLPQPSSAFLAPYQQLSQYMPESVFKLILVAVFGGLYYILDIRNSFLRDTHRLIQMNIKIKLLSPFANDPELKPRLEELKSSNALMHTFYSFIDNDESLKAKASNVYFNGLLWSSVADLQAVSLIAGLIFIIVFGIVGDFTLYAYSVAYLLATVVARFFLLPKITEKHIQYSNDQLEFITQKYPKELRDKLIAIPH